jgi:hypothetical protein
VAPAASAAGWTRLAPMKWSERLSRSMSAAAASIGGSRSAAWRVATASASRARLRSVEALEHRGEQPFGLVAVVVGDRAVEAGELGGDELGQRHEQRQVAGGQLGSRPKSARRLVVAEMRERARGAAGVMGEPRPGEVVLGGSAPKVAAALGLAARSARQGSLRPTRDTKVLPGSSAG